jgi:hypothetical protein
MKIKKNLKGILDVISNCPAMYWQNIIRKNFPYRDRCINAGHNICGSFLNCPKWKTRLDCWKWVNDIDDRFNER